MQEFSLFIAPKADVPVFQDGEDAPLVLKEPPALSLSAKHAVLMTAEGVLLYGKNEHIPAEMASTTKVMTALLAVEYLERVPLSKTARISKNAVGVEGSSVYLEENEEIAVLDLVYALMLASANDAAIALAEEIGGTVEDFVVLMNEKAKTLGLDSTHFENPHGLPSENHYTTAYALGKLMAKAMAHPLFARITATKHYTMQSGNATRHLANHNRLLSEDGILGGKTGFTKRAGRCLVSVCEREGARLFAVTFSAPDDWNDHRALYDYGYTHYEAVRVPAERYTLPVIAGKTTTVTVASPEAVLVLPKEREALDFFRMAPRFVYAPIAQGDTVGTLTVSLSGKTLITLPYIVEDTVKEEKTPSFWEKLFS